MPSPTRNVQLSRGAQLGERGLGYSFCPARAALPLLHRLEHPHASRSTSARTTGVSPKQAKLEASAAAALIMEPQAGMASLAAKPAHRPARLDRAPGPRRPQALVGDGRGEA